MTVKENLLCLRFRPGGEAGPGQRRRRQRNSCAWWLTEKINAYPSQLSGGQQRRVAIARAFMNGPALILADEPTGDLDEETEMDMMNFFRTMNRADKITFIMVTHNTDLANQSSAGSE
jgi:putative ABC transport system ATP-binding protein/lipoprotein-releasing system ATP-binding protein